MINKANIKTLLGITNTDSDAKIDLLLPQLIQSIIDYCNNEFIFKTIDGYVFDNVEMTINSTTVSMNTSIPIVDFDFIKLHNTGYNDGVYQVLDSTPLDSTPLVLGSTYTLDRALRPEISNSTVYLINFPNQFLQIIAQGISSNLNLENSNIKREKLDDAEYEYFGATDLESMISDNSSILNNFRKIYKKRVGGYNEP